MYNEFTAVGRLTRDVELRYTPQGVAVAHFTVATNHKTKDKDEPFYIDCVVWDNLAEACNQYVHKGSKVFVKGRLYTESWEHEGKKHSRVKCRVSNLLMLDSKNEPF